MSICLLESHRILIVGPSPDWGTLDRILVDEGYEVEAVPDLAHAEETLRSRMPSLVMVGIALSQPTINRVRNDICTRDIPIIVVSDGTDTRLAFAALDRGASDLVSAPIIADELLARVRLQLRSVRRILELRRATIVDELTGARNRRGAMDALTSELRRAQRNGSELSIAMIDVDHFKSINDTLGHAVGDRVLTELAAAFTDVVRRVDMVGRLGGDEFLIVLADTPLERAHQVCQRLSEAASTIGLSRPMADVSVSIGLASCKGGDLSASELLEAADKAMYVDKSRFQRLAISA